MPSALAVRLATLAAAASAVAVSLMSIVVWSAGITAGAGAAVTPAGRFCRVTLTGPAKAGLRSTMALMTNSPLFAILPPAGSSLMVIGAASFSRRAIP